MSPLETILAVTALVGFLLTCLTFIAGVWKLSWAVRGWVEAQQIHAQNTREVTGILRDFVEVQKDANRQLHASVLSLNERLERFDSEREDLHRAVRAVNRKLVYLEGENAEVQRHAT
ncbi:MAG TPA: hypothetical protein VFC10_07395 [Terriglobia bacterium]|jgi:hypothetical protein|nr:hypothetical protein [Terracidiphilus sp.]HZT69558.1 hypothetical protein [Terriglobia bacterium]